MSLARAAFHRSSDSPRRRLVLRSLLILCIGAVAPMHAQTSAVPVSTTPVLEERAATADATPTRMAERHRRWLAEVEPLIAPPERALFLALGRDYQRDAFVERFWRVRDPYPRTARNELKERWPLRVAEAKSRFGTLQDDRAVMLMVHGEPAQTQRIRCTGNYAPAEIWAYAGSDWVDVGAVMVFLIHRRGEPAVLWRPGQFSARDEGLLSRVQGCYQGGQLLALLGSLQNEADAYSSSLQRYLIKPRPTSTEWVDTFAAYTTDAPAEGAHLAGDLELLYPGRHQHRTVVQGAISIDRTRLEASDYAGYRSYELQLVGEVLHDGDLFETFRYRYGFPADGAPDRLAMGFQRYLRPGDFTLVLRLDDLVSGAVYREERPISVPAVDTILEQPRFHDPETERLFAEATAAIAAGETGLRIVPPHETLLTGPTRFATLVSGDEVRKVRFLLDDRVVMTKNRPPFHVEIDLGDFPDLHELRVEGLDAVGEIVADDEIWINGGGYRFLVDLREPRPGARYEQSLQVRVDVEVPDGRTLERLEIYLDEDRIATLFQPPFAHPVVLPRAGHVGYVRAVAYLADGYSTEDLVFVNAPHEVDEVEVQFVELYTTALDGRGRPVDDLRQEEFSVLEDNVEQTIARFEELDDLPIHVGVLLDTSASMAESLDAVRRAALDFFDQAIRPRDRAAVIPFANFPHLAVELTGDHAALGAGLAGLSPGGRTALYDSVMFSLYYFTGVRGQRALLVLSDGRDESSRFTFDDTLEYARRAGITIYTIGLDLGDRGARSKLARLADETGGRSFFLKDTGALPQAYATIQRELRSQLLIAYQSSNTADDEAFRRVELQVARPGVEVKTLSGYYP